MLEKQIELETVTSPDSKEVFNSNIYFYREYRPEYPWSLDLNDYSKQLLQIKSDEFAQKQFWILCSLPNNKVLCFWNRGKKDSGAWFSLDSQGHIFRFKKPSHKETARPIAVYYKNDIVYIFGFMKWYKLDIYRNIYFTIAGRSNSSYYSCTLLYDYIIISSEKSIYTFEVYDILTNSKSTMNSIEIGGVKHLFTLNENLYAVDYNGYLFSLGFWNLDEWKFMGIIKYWGIDKFSYWLYYNNDAYFMTNCIEVVKFSIKLNNIDAEISQIYPIPKKEIRRLDDSITYENIFSSILPSWKELFNPAINESLKHIWSLITFKNFEIGIFPFILKKKIEIKKNYPNLDLNKKFGYIFESFRKKEPRTIKIIILFPNPKRFYDFQELAKRIESIRNDLNVGKIKKLKKNIVVLSPMIVSKFTGEKSIILKEFTIEMTKVLNTILDRAVFMLWGKEARSYLEFVDQSKHLLIENVNLLSLNEEKIKKFKDSEQFQLAYSYLYG